MSVLIRIYDFFTRHRRWLWTLLLILVAGLAVCISRLHYSEDIFDFLPKDEEYTESMQVFSSLSEASRIVIIFEGSTRDSLCEAIDAFAAHPMCPVVAQPITEVDVDGFLSRLEYIYAHLPYFLSDSDYAHLNQLLSPDSIAQRIAQDKALLSTPGTSLLLPSVRHDPLRLIPFAMGATGQYAAAQSAFTSYNGYMMLASQNMGFAFYDTPYGSTESAQNTLLVDSLQMVCQQVEKDFPEVQVRLLGSPVVAVGNARCIKRDTLLCIGLSLLLIAALLLYSFPKKRDILWIGLSVTFGWIVGMAALAICFQTISLIVLGIGSVFIGISVNYPLHLLVHQRYTTSVRQTLQEVLAPLIVGNITTIGAFLALVPLHAAALQQLGVFAAADLLGTILFCVLFLPHLMAPHQVPLREIPLPARHLHPHSSAFIGWSALILLILLLLPLCIHSQTSLFDANISHLNYMSRQQRSDFAHFASLTSSSSAPAYTPASAREELRHREEAWFTFWQQHDPNEVIALMQKTAAAEGLRPELFEPFYQTITQSTFINPPATLSSELAQLWPGRFDTEYMQTRIAQSLSDNFDYLTTVCSLLVLVFLCFSFRSVWLGLIAFLPMLLSGAVIVSLMQIFGLQFNIVSVILVTFIFGQGDDYTIFVVEGLLYEHQTGKKILAQYRQSILLSALIMLIAIGVLVLAKHPAMYSLGLLTLIGMSSVVLMAFLVPPVLFRIYLRLTHQ